MGGGSRGGRGGGCSGTRKLGWGRSAQRNLFNYENVALYFMFVLLSARYSIRLFLYYNVAREADGSGAEGNDRESKREKKSE